MSDAPGSPKAARLGSPSWLDGRLVLGVLLVLVSVLVGAKLLASADTSQQVWVATHDLAPGTVLASGDLQTGRVRLFGASSLYVAGAKPSGYVVQRGIRKNELLPVDSLSAPGVVVARRDIAVPVPTGQGVPDIYPRVIGAADANGDGRQEVVVKLSAILYHVGGQQIAGMYGMQNGRVRPVKVAGRGRLVFRLGGISRYGDGALCTVQDGRPVFVIRHIEQVLPSSWRWTERPFGWQGLMLHPSKHRTGLLPVTLPVTDPRVEPFYQLRCGPIREP